MCSTFFFARKTRFRLIYPPVISHMAGKSKSMARWWKPVRNLHGSWKKSSDFPMILQGSEEVPEELPEAGGLGKDMERWLVSMGFVPSGNLLHSYWKWPFIVDLPIENGGSFHSYVNVYQRVAGKIHIFDVFWWFFWHILGMLGTEKIIEVTWLILASCRDRTLGITVYFREVIPNMAELFRLVKYDNLPRWFDDFFKIFV